METLTINIPDKKSALVKQILKGLGVTIQNANKTENRRDKGYANSKLGSQGVSVFAICKFECSDLSANSPNALHAYLLISILSIPVDPI